MIIRKLRMENFRGFRDKTIIFDDKSVVLLTAPNGIGKTTTIDAIEWCLTGDIGRLKTAFDTRSTNDSERRMNTNGILKNRDAGTNDMVRVSLWLCEGEEEIILRREQKKDELNPDTSKAFINESEEIAEKFLIQHNINESFYNFHFCDVQKSFNIQNKKRRDIESLFSEFITNYDDEKQIAENLYIFAEDVSRYIDDNKYKQKVLQELIMDREKQLARVREQARQLQYPENGFFQGEKIDITELNEKELNLQKSALNNCGYLIAQSDLEKLIGNETLKKQETILEKICFFWKTKGEYIRHAISAGLSKNTEAISVLEARYNKYRKITFSKEVIFSEVDAIIPKDNGTLRLEFDKDRAIIQEKEKKVSCLSSDINLLSQNNKILSFLSNLSANKQIIIDYRNNSLKENDIVKCPVCGSLSFSTIEESLILKEVDEYIKNNDQAVKEKEVEKYSLQVEIDTLYQKIINRARSIVENEQRVLESEIIGLKNLKDEIQPYFDAVNDLVKLGIRVTVEDMSEEKAEVLLADTKNNVLPEAKVNELNDDYQRILTVLGYKFDNETLQQTHAKVVNLIDESFTVSNFTYEMFVSKLNAIDSVLANQSLSALIRELESENEKNNELNNEINKLQSLKDVAQKKAQRIRNIVDELSRDEYEKIGPALGKYYNKLIRIDSSNGIHLIHKNDGISLVDDKSKNIVNILSNGQISVFMLAYFFAGINARNEREKMKIFFIDDLTACMDDVNMLAFLDLLKYQISSKGTIEQLFFVTCDDRISKLFRYKLEGRGIDPCVLSETNFI